jgi:hypothetical protein
MPHTTEMFLDQPNGKFILPMRSEKALAGPSVNWAALADVYRSIGKLGPIEVAYVGGELALIVPGQPAYPLVERSKDSFVLGGLPADKWGLVVLRSTRGTIAGVVLNQPNGSFEFTPTASKKADMTLAKLQSRVIAAAGGEDRLRRLTSITAEAEIEFEGQGLTGKARLYNKAPNLFASDLDLFAFGKPVARMHDFLGAEAEGIQTEGEAIKPHAPEKLEQLKIEADLREPLNWQSNYKEVVLKGRSKINSEDCYAVVKRLASGNQLVEYYSATTFLLIRQDFIVKTSSNGEASKTDTTTYSDYRDVDGLMMSFAQKGTVDGLAMNVRIASLKVDLPIGAEVFQARPVAGQ